VQICCLSGRPLKPDFTDPNWQVGFSIPAGGTVCLEARERLRKEGEREMRAEWQRRRGAGEQGDINNQFPMPNSPCPMPHAQTVVVHRQEIPVISSRPGAMELALLQHLSQPEIMQIDGARDHHWLSVEQILRQYAQYQLGRPIRSATLIDSYFAANHDATV
jgi:DNA repair protein RecO (recombination protein O)